MDNYNKILKKVEKLLGNQVTTNLELDKAGKKLIGEKFLGTFSADTVPVLEDGECCITNLDDSNEAGSHWIALFKNGDNLIVYDSFGRPTKKIIPNLLKGYGRIKDTEYDAEQRDEEENCGARSLSALIYGYKYGTDKLLKL